METKILALSDVLVNSNSFPWNFALYLPFDEKWVTGTRCAVLDTSECGKDENDLHFAKSNGLEYAIGMQQVQAIVDNAKSQKKDVEIDLLLEALLFYYDNDAFISIKE